MTLAAANGLYLVLLLLGGMVIPLDELPDAARVVARALPSGALAEAVRRFVGRRRVGGRPGRGPFWSAGRWSHP